MSASAILHLHDHAVVSDGVFQLDYGVLRFKSAPPPAFEEVAELVEGLRRRILKRMLRLRVLPEATVSEMLSWPHGGFSLDGGTYVEAQDRASLERWAVSQTARQKAGAIELEAGYSVTVSGKVERAARKAVRASARAWAACLTA